LWGTLVGECCWASPNSSARTSNNQYQLLAGNILFLVVLAIRPQGLFGKKAAMS